MRKTCLKSVFEIAKKNNKVIFLGSDLGPGTLQDFKNQIPERYFMEGVSEQHIIGMAAGLAMDGFLPYVNTIATFITRRCLEQIIIDLCLQDLPVKLIGNGGGLVYAPLGPTHQALDDIAILRSIPNMTIVAPCDEIEMKKLIYSSLSWPHPIYIRLAKGGDEIITSEETKFEIGKSVLFKKPEENIILSTGVMTQIALETINDLSTQGIKCGLLHMHTIKPLDTETLYNIIPYVKKVITIEEHYKINGFGTAILEFCNENMPEHVSKINRIGFPEKFADEYGNQSTLLNAMGINKNLIIKLIKS